MTREEELIRKMQNKDADAANALIKMYYPEILRYCIWHAPNRSLAEDAAQETFLKTIRYIDQYSQRGRFKSFLYQVAANTCIDMRRRKWEGEISLDELSEEEGYLEKGFDRVQEDWQLRQLIKNLPEQLQEIVVLRYGQELKLREIAQIVNLPLRTVQSKLRQALRKLKKELEGREP